jgi:hypothetical protein
MKMLCGWCRQQVQQPTAKLNIALREQRPVYCNKDCAGMARRSGKTEAEKKAEKREYDKAYRAANFERIKAEKAAWFQANYDPAKASVERKARMHLHVEYCRRPEYRAKKAEYDRKRRFQEFGPFADAAMVLDQLEKEIRARASWYEVAVAKGYFTRNAQKRRRELWQQLSKKT